MLEGLSVTRAPRGRRPQVDFEDLGFGKYFSDHMFSMRWRDGRWEQPEVIPYGEVGIEPGAASLHYGQTVFEGLKAFLGKDGRVRVFRPDMNAKRLYDSCRRLCIPPIEEGGLYDAVRP